MSYLINKFNGDELVILEDGTVNVSTSLGLVGRNYVGYGEIQNENFVFLLENFANAEAPSRPITGQLWYDTDIETLKIYNGNAWGIVGSAQLSDTAPEDKREGSLWIDTVNNILYVWSGAEWIFIGPESAPGFGVTRARSATVIDNTELGHPVILLTINDTVIGIIANDSFRLSGDPGDSFNGFLDIEPGINLSNTVTVNGDLKGTASRATVLETRRTINGIGFDGSQNITITANTTNHLVSGPYISGSDFNGSTQVTWEVDASPENRAGKIVARNANGDFSANIITSDVVGNLTGNVNSTGTSNFNIVTASEFRGAVLTGNAFTATKLNNSREINGVEFDGSQNITVPVSGRDVTGDTLASAVKFSSLQSVGVLQSLDVDNTGIEIGSGKELKLSVDSGAPVIESSQASLTLEIDQGSSRVQFLSSSVIDGSDNPTISAQNWNIGSPAETLDNIYADNFIGRLVGNSDTATLATTATNIQGGGLGAIPYQTASGTTSFVAPLANKILRSNGSGVPSWGEATFADLIPGDYINGSTYTGLSEETWSINATDANTSSAIVARDTNGNFSAGTITADLSGTASQATSVYIEETGTGGGLFTSGDPNEDFNVVFQGESSAGDRFTNLQVDNGGLQFNPFTNTISGTNLTLDGRATDNVEKAGDTMTGSLTLNADPTANLHAATKQYVDSVVQTEITALGAGLVRAFVKFDGSDLNIANTLNVSAVQRISAGRYRLTFIPGTFENADYVMSGMASDTDHFVAFRNSSVDSVDIFTVDNGSGNNTPSNTSGAVMVTFFT